MTVLEQVQAAETGTVVVSYYAATYGTIVAVKVSPDRWRYQDTHPDGALFKELDDFAIGTLLTGEKLHIIPPDALAQFEVTE